MAAHGRIGGAEQLLSTLALAPVAYGATLGKRLRSHLRETGFLHVLLDHISSGKLARNVRAGDLSMCVVTA